MRSTKLLVSIHDVTPAFQDEVNGLWQMCRRVGVTPALLVVPNWHGAWPLDSHTEYVQWLHARHARIAAPALRWSARTSMRARMSAAVATLRFTVHRNVPLLRIALHPQDLAHPLVMQSIEHELGRWTSHGKAVRYDSL